MNGTLLGDSGNASVVNDNNSVLNKNKIKRIYHAVVCILDTGTGAYLRENNTLFRSSIQSELLVNTAGPGNLKASQTGLLNLLVKNDKGHLHQLMLENAFESRLELSSS